MLKSDPVTGRFYNECIKLLEALYCINDCLKKFVEMKIKRVKRELVGFTGQVSAAASENQVAGFQIYRLSARRIHFRGENSIFLPRVSSNARV